MAWMVLLLVLLGGWPASADSGYRYVDERGTAHWVQHLSQVPPQYRGQVVPVPPPRPATRSILRSGVGLAVDGGQEVPVWYIRSAHTRIERNWREKAPAGRSTTVVFEVSRFGNVIQEGLRIEGSSGDPRYDAAALQAVRLALPFPPLPTTVDEPFLRFRATLYPSL